MAVQAKAHRDAGVRVNPPAEPAAQAPSQKPAPSQAQSPGINRKRNLRTALILLSIAAVFFAGVVLNRVFFG